MKKTEPALLGADRKVCNDAAHSSDFPAVGDFVMAGKTGEGTQAVIHQVLPRKSVFMRKAAGSDRKEQLVATNIDIVFLCISDVNEGISQCFLKLGIYFIIAQKGRFWNHIFQGVDNITG